MVTEVRIIIYEVGMLFYSCYKSVLILSDATYVLQRRIMTRSAATEVQEGTCVARCQIGGYLEGAKLEGI